MSNLKERILATIIFGLITVLHAGVWAEENDRSEDEWRAMLVGEWDGTFDTDNRILLTLNADGTFEMLNVDPRNRNRIKVRATGKFKTNFTVYPAHLDLHAIIHKPKHEDPVKHKFELIVKMASLNSFRMSDLESMVRPKAFGKKSTIMRHRIPHLKTPAEAIRFYKTAVIARDWEMAQVCLAAELCETLQDSITNREFFDQYAVAGFATKTLELLPARNTTDKDIADIWVDNPRKPGPPRVGVGPLPKQFTAQVGHGGGGTPWMARCTFVREEHGWKLSVKRIKTKEDFMEWHRKAIAESDRGKARQLEQKNDAAQIALTLDAKDTIELSPIEMQLTVTNKSDKAIAVSALMQSSVLILNGNEYQLQAPFHVQWKKLKAIPPKQSVVVTSSTTYYGIGGTSMKDHYPQHEIKWHDVLTMGMHAVAVRVDGGVSNVTQAVILADH